MANLHKILLSFTLSGLIFSGSMAQDKSVYEKMSLDEILDVDVVVTASKKPEDLFEAPLSTTIIKREDIANSGVTSIPEALRLAPGLIVREITPGNFDVHIRGFDDVSKNGYISLPYNTTMLVMIDNRIVYSYFSGGTFWETFPIDLNDIERIEVVRGPASALYGPNAATGVINIITSQASNKGMNVSANGLAGNNRMRKANTNIGYNWGDKTKLAFSANFDERYRFKTEYFNYTTQSYTSLENQHLKLPFEKNLETHELYSFKEFAERVDLKYDEDVSLKKMGGNVFFYHRFRNNTDVDISMGAQKSQSQKLSFSNFITPLSQTNSESYYLNSRLKHNDFYGQFNLASGEDLNNFRPNSYKYTNIDANIEYFKQFKKVSIRPGISYKQSVYNSPITYNDPFTTATFNYQFQDKARKLRSFAASMLSEWKPGTRLRFIGATRLDKFNINKNYFFNVELAATYRMNKNNLLRFVYSRANRSPFVFDTYLNANFKINLDYKSEYNQNSVVVPIDLNIHACKNLKFPIVKNHEFSWRSKLNSKLNMDVELFYSNIKNLIVSDVYNTANATDHVNENNLIDSVFSISSIAHMLFENFNVKAQQFGISINLEYHPTEKLESKIFGTIQKTIMSGETESKYMLTGLNYGEADAGNNITVETRTFSNPTQWSEKLTPTFYGGFVVNYNCNSKWNFNTDAYFTSKQRFIDYDYANTMSYYSGIYNNYYMDIKANLVLNAKVSYHITKHITGYGTIKNILGNHREYGYADQIGRLFLVGIIWEL